MQMRRELKGNSMENPQLVNVYCGCNVMRTIIKGKGGYYDECRLDNRAVAVEYCISKNAKLNF